jgi:hypothetical protein
MHRLDITHLSVFAALKKIHTDDCLNQTEQDLCLSKRGAALEEFPATVHACGSNKVTYVTKQDLLCAAKTKPGTCI